MKAHVRIVPNFGCFSYGQGDQYRVVTFDGRGQWTHATEAMCLEEARRERRLATGRLRRMKRSRKKRRVISGLSPWEEALLKQQGVL